MAETSLDPRYELVVGLEVHAQLLTHSKAYNPDPNSYGEEPNESVGVITLAHPGTLPKANATVVDYAIRMGLALGSEITRYNHYDRKNYFYPDLPKGYQITQDKTPICRGGQVVATLKDGTERIIGVTRIHMEEDAGKSMHLPGAPDSLIDLNRAGVPLIEIVSEPDIRSTDEAYAYLTEVHRLVRYLGICDGNMEEGSLRCDANVSVRLHGAKEYGKRVELKNMNSFRNVARAIEHEAMRQVALIDAGQEIISETRTYDAGTGESQALRNKETLNDYRYFPEPDLQPVIVSDRMLADIEKCMPELPRALTARMVALHGLSAYDAGVLVEDREVAEYYLQTTALRPSYKAVANWIMGPIKSAMNAQALSLQQVGVGPERLAKLVALVDEGKVSFSAASQKLFAALRDQLQAEPEALARELNLIMDQNQDELRPIVEAVLASLPEKVAEYRSGKKGLLGLFMGEVMKRSQGKANPKEASKLVAELLG